MGNKIWLELSNLEAWNNNTKVLDNINLKIREGENVAILGPNGSGKSSLLKVINRSLYPIHKNPSSIKLFNSEVIDIWRLRSRIGLITSDINFRINKSTNVINVIKGGYFGRFSITNREKTNIKQNKDVINILNELNLINYSNKKYHELSDGQKKVVLIARALIHKPRILILDEPTSSLDIRASQQIRDILSKLCKTGVNIVQVTHDIENIIEDINRIVFIKNGRILKEGSKEELINSTEISKLFDIKIKCLKINGHIKLLKFTQ